MPLHNLSRRHRDNQIANDLFRILLQRRLRLPVIPLNMRQLPCPTCKVRPDPYGDHYFSCAQYHKTFLHNSVRDALFLALQKLAPIAEITHTHLDVQFEPPGLLPTLPSKRPADVAIHLIPNAIKRIPLNHHTVCVDVTIPPPPLPPPPSVPIPERLHEPPPGLLNPLHPAIHSANTAHLKASCEKCRRDEALMYHINRQGLILVPFTVDHLGSLGHFAHQLLYANHKKPPGPKPPEPPWTDAQFGNPRFQH